MACGESLPGLGSELGNIVPGTLLVLSEQMSGLTQAKGEVWRCRVGGYMCSPFFHLNPPRAMGSEQVEALHVCFYRLEP